MRRESSVPGWSIIGSGIRSSERKESPLPDDVILSSWPNELGLGFGHSLGGVTEMLEANGSCMRRTYLHDKVGEVQPSNRNESANGPPVEPYLFS